jgi:type I restriction enzyme S subunit
MRDGWVHTSLGEVADIYQPQTIAKALMDDSAEYIVYGANGPIGRYHQFNHADREVVVTCRGATCGTINMTPEKTWITGNAMVVHPKSDLLDKQFLFYSLISVVDVHSIISGSAQPQITREGMLPVKISIPPLPQQKRIVDLISCVDLYISLVNKQDMKTLESISLLGSATRLRAALLSDLLSGKHEIPASYDLIIENS